MKTKRASFLVLILILLGCEEDTGIIDASSPIQVGIIAGVEFFEPTIQGFQDQLTEIGYQEGVNIEYDIRRAKGSVLSMKQFAHEFVEQDVDLLFTVTNGAAIAARDATKGTNIPVVFTIVMAPVESGVVDSLTTPSGNVTGIRNPLGEFIGKRLEILKQLAPLTRSVLVLYDPSYPTAPLSIKGLRQASVQLDIKLLEIPVNSANAIVSLLDNAKELEVDAVLIMPDPIAQTAESLDAMMRFSSERGVPVVANTPRQAENGALFSYLSDSYETGIAAARLANDVLAKKTVQALPIISSEPKLILNLKAADSLALTVDPSLVTLSQRLIE